MRYFSIALLTILLPLCTRAQDFRATLSGQVTDRSGAAIPDAKVRAVDRATNQATVADTNQDGFFTLPYLAPGIYDVEVEATGFSTVRRSASHCWSRRNWIFPFGWTWDGQRENHGHGRGGRSADVGRFGRPQLRFLADLRVPAQRTPGLHADGPYSGRSLHPGAVRLFRLLRPRAVGTLRAPT